MTTLAAESAVSLLISNNGFLEVATGGGFGSVTITPTGGVAVSEAWGPAPFRKRWTGYPDGAAVSLTNTTSASFDYETDTTNLPLAVQALVQGGGNAPTFVAQAAPSGSGDLYARFIAEIDAWILGREVQKIDAGAASDDTRVYEYRAGSGPLPFVVISGTHGEELVSVWCSYSFFKWFVSDPGAASLRSQISLSWVPALNASRFGVSRVNSNGVDIDSNCPFYWDRFTSEVPGFVKGPSAESESEVTIVRTLLDTRRPLGIVFCHNAGPDFFAEDISVTSPSYFNVHNRHIYDAANEDWRRAYGGTFTDFVNPLLPMPTVNNWATFHMTVTQGRWQASAVTIEAKQNSYGSSDAGATAAIATKYAGYINKWITAAIKSQATQPTVIQHAWAAQRITPASSVSVASGGTMVDSGGGWQNLTFDAQSPYPVGFTARDYLDTPLVMNGDLEITFSGYVQSVGTSAQQLEFGMSLDGNMLNDGYSGVVVPGVVDQQVNWLCKARVPAGTVDASYIPRIRGRVRRTYGANQAPFIVRAIMTVNFIPYVAHVWTPTV